MAIPGCRNCQAGKSSAAFRQREWATEMSRPIILVGCWPRRMTADLAATYAASAKAALADFGANPWRPALEDLSDFAVARTA